MILVDARIEQYAAQHTSRPSELLERLARETEAARKDAQMLTGVIEGQLLRLLVKMIGAKRVLEVGMFTGYSALSMASALPDDGELVTCDKDPVVVEIARRYFEESPDGHKIQIRVGPAMATLATLEGPFDFAFLDADKQSYPDYYDRLMELVRPGGIITIDNVLWSGEVLEPRDEETRAIHALNEKVKADRRVEHVLATVRDGLLIVRKRD
jgi:caffeoyl-CoA O-methyltransferase